jgi:hypothetical protein
MILSDTARNTSSAHTLQRDEWYVYMGLAEGSSKTLIYVPDAILQCRHLLVSLSP